jgi:hypothetical protein
MNPKSKSRCGTICVEVAALRTRAGWIALRPPVTICTTPAANCNKGNGAGKVGIFFAQVFLDDLYQSSACPGRRTGQG